VPDVVPGAEQVRVALDELLGWPGISRSPQLSELLRYVVEKKLGGDEASIKAYSIAVDVFGRPQSFDPQADPIVRVQARRLRTLLEQFYDGGLNESEVQIHLPLGRYVPEFESVAKGAAAGSGAKAEPPAHAGPAKRSGRLSRRFLFNAVLGLGFTLIGVGLAVLLIRWTIPQQGPPAPVYPDFPRVTVGTFDNLTGEPGLDGEVAQFGPRLAAALGRFDAVKVAPDGGLVLHGSVQEDKGQFTVRALLADGSANGISWSTIVRPGNVAGSAPLRTAVLLLAAQLGNASGPLHAPGRAWLKTLAKPPEQPTLYVCDLQYMAWRDSRRMADGEAAIACYDHILIDEPDNAMALAADAGLKAWRSHYTAATNQDLAALMADQTTAASRAVSLQPADSFVYEQQGLVLARQGSLDAAMGALNKAVELNPANMDAAAADGLVTWLNGSFEEGSRLGEQAITTVLSPPPWYYMTRAFNALREKHYYDAIDAAVALAAGDEEFGPAVALAAAPIVGRTDIIDRYRPQMLANGYFQSGGILPRLAMMMKPQILMGRMREGLVLAGIPPAALAAPFNPAGTPKR
jgi:tetratricopeptide (TPR) repeat protein